MHLVKDEHGNVMHHHHDHDHHHDHCHCGDHDHHHSHSHDHDHSHECGHDCQCGCGETCDCTPETVALLSYMLDHNTHHAVELDQMADNLSKMGMTSVAKQIKDAVSDFQKGNLRLSLALTLMKESVK